MEDRVLVCGSGSRHNFGAQLLNVRWSAARCPAVQLLRKLAVLLADDSCVCNHCSLAAPSLGHLLHTWAKDRWGGLPTLSAEEEREKHTAWSHYAYFYNRDFSQRQLILMSRRYLSLCAATAQWQAGWPVWKFGLILFYRFTTVCFQLMWLECREGEFYSVWWFCNEISPPMSLCCRKFFKV